MAAEAAPFSFTAYRREDAAGRDLGIVHAPAAVDHATLLKGNVIGCLTAVYDSAHFGKVEMPPLPLRQDYALWLALLRPGGAARGLDEVLADYRVGAGLALRLQAPRRPRHLGRAAPRGPPPPPRALVLRPLRRLRPPPPGSGPREERASTRS